MSRFVVGDATLLIAEHAEHEEYVKDFSGSEQLARVTPAVVAGPGLQLEVAHLRWYGGGQIVALGRGDGSPVYDRLLHGVRLGIKCGSDGLDYCEVDLLDWDAAQSWGNMKMATEGQLHALVDELDPLLVSAGALDFGTRERVLADAGKRRNRLCVTFPAEDPVAPLLAYVVTRVLPIMSAQERAS